MIFFLAKSSYVYECFDAHWSLTALDLNKRILSRLPTKNAHTYIRHIHMIFMYVSIINRDVYLVKNRLPATGVWQRVLTFGYANRNSDNRGFVQRRFGLSRFYCILSFQYRYVYNTFYLLTYYASKDNKTHKEKDNKF